MPGISKEIMFEKFEILEVLKKDEHAAVYLANHIYLSKKIILKVLNTEKLPEPAILERFKREAKLLAKLEHPNIIKVLDFGTSKEYFYISFEYIEGTSLRNILNAKTLTYEDKKHLIVQLLKALHYAHSFQIIHRDIKPENILVDNNLNLKLGDFGLALSSEDSLVTNPYSIVGTPSYMSPEQVRGAKLTQQSDLFSAGVVFFEMFTGKNPFLRDNVSLTLNEIMSYNEGSLDENIKDLDQEIKDVLYHLLKKKPEQRYACAADVLNDLKVSIEQQTLVISRDERKLRADKTKMAVVIIALVIIFSTIISIQLFKNNPANPVNSNKITDTTENILSSKQNNPNSSGTDQINLNDTSKLLLDNSADSGSVNTLQENINNKPIAYGALIVNCYPSADVYVDGERIGDTPMPKPRQFLAGNHTLKLVHPDYPPYSKEIIIHEGEPTKVNVLLDTTMSYIKCDVSPWGNVYVNGDMKGTTPLGLIKVVPGFINLSIKNQYYKSIDTVFKIRQNDTLRFKFSLKK